MYNRIVAPELPVPLSRTTIRLPSSNLMKIPWCVLTLPSTGSLYSKSPASATLKLSKVDPTNEEQLVIALSVMDAMSLFAASESTSS